MKINFFPLVIALSTLAITETATAQNISNNLNEPTNYQSNEYDPTLGPGGSFDPMDLIHRATMGPSRNPSQFNEDTQKNISNAAEDFKKQQQQLLEQNTSGSTAAQ